MLPLLKIVWAEQTTLFLGAGLPGQSLSSSSLCVSGSPFLQAIPFTDNSQRLRRGNVDEIATNSLVLGTWLLICILFFLFPFLKLLWHQSLEEWSFCLLKSTRLKIPSI